MSASEPFDYLLQLARQIRSAGPQLPAEAEIQNSWSGIGFNVLGQRMVAPLGEVVEMLPVPGATRLPGVQDWVMGLANVRGRLLPLFDLEMFLGGKLSANKSRHRVLVLEMSDLYAGLVVSEAYGMQHFPQGLDPVPLPDSISHLQPYSQGAYEFNGTVWTRFSPYHLIRDPRFFNAAAA
ncbi:MAG TPA: chemotaxis protein CheW [Pseudomonadales bacterium]